MSKGECNCGVVKYTVDADISGVIRCHCSICRRGSGANGIAIVVAPADKFAWDHGEDQITTWQKPDSQWRTGFCKHCGSPVPGKNEQMNMMFIPAGSIAAGGEPTKVDQHIWVGSKADWDVIGDEGFQHSEGFPSQ